MERTFFDEGWELFRSFLCCASGGRRFYTRKERIARLEQIKQRLQQELAGIEELIQDLKPQQTS